MITLTQPEAADHLRSARVAHAEFVTKRGAHEERLTDLAKERAALAFDAHRGDPKARKRLDALHLEIARADSEAKSIDAAIEEADRRCRDAEDGVARAEQAEKARQVLELLPQLREHGRVLDEAARTVLESYAEFQRTARTIRSLTDPGRDVVGLPLSHERAVPSEGLMRVTCRRSLIAHLTGTDLEFERLAPGDRHDFATVVDGWARGIEAWASRRLSKQTEEAA
jgi:hypothetical protein